MDRRKELSDKIEEILKEHNPNRRSIGDIGLGEVLLAANLVFDEKGVDGVLDFSNQTGMIHYIKSLEYRETLWEREEGVLGQPEKTIKFLGEYFKIYVDKGLINKYTIQKNDGSNIDPDSRYFVLRYDKGAEPIHREACRNALSTYISQIQEHLPKLAEELGDELRKEIVGD